MVLQQRFDFEPSCCAVLPAARGIGEAQVASGLLVASRQRTLMVYRSRTLVWAAKTRMVPVSVETACVADISGMLVLRGDQGLVEVCYLGTDPALPRAPSADTTHNSADPAFGDENHATDNASRKGAIAAGGSTENIEHEYERLLTSIHRATAAKTGEPSALPQLNLNASILSRADASESSRRQSEQDFDSATASPIAKHRHGDHNASFSQTDQLGLTSAADRTSGVLRVEILSPLSNSGAFKDITLNLTSTDCIILENSLVHINDLATQNSGDVPIEVSQSLLPSSATVHVVCTYSHSDTSPGALAGDSAAADCDESAEDSSSRCVTTCEVAVPFRFFARAVPPVRDATCTLVLTTNREAVPLLTLFDDFLPPFAEKNAEIGRVARHVMSVQYNHDGSGRSETFATVLVSKKGGRYKLQGTSFSGLWPLLDQLHTRLQAHFVTNADELHGVKSPLRNQDDFRISVAGDIPLKTYCEAIERYSELHESTESIKSDIERCTRQMLVVQKRLFARFKDKNPSSVEQVTRLLTRTHDYLARLTKNLADTQHRTSAAANELSCATRLMLLLLRFKFDLDSETDWFLRRFLSPEIEAGETQSWHLHTEQTLAAFVAMKDPKKSASIASAAESQRELLDNLRGSGKSLSFDARGARWDPAKLTRLLGETIQKLASGFRAADQKRASTVSPVKKKR